jgi:hemolysin activation/secretion protein
MWGINLTHRQWIALNQDQTLVYAYRIGYDRQGGDIPFFHQSIMGGSQWVELGGNSVLRGYEFGRIREKQNIYTSHELRWILSRLHLKKRPIDLMLTPLFDGGFVGSWSKGKWVGSAGIGGRVIYDESFVVRLDFVFAREQHQTNQGVISVARHGIYALVGHSF